MKRCRICKEKFAPSRPLQPTCGFECHLKYADQVIAKSKAKQAKEERKKDKERKEKLKNRGDYLAEAKKEIQKFRRLEELSKDSGCMSCLRSQQEVEAGEWRPGGYWDGGHFQSKGARPELALEPLNIWLQCKACNGGSGKYARKGYTVNQNFETNLRAQEGDALVDWLKGPHEPAKHTIEDLKQIIQTYRAKARGLEKA